MKQGQERGVSRRTVLGALVGALGAAVLPGASYSDDPRHNLRLQQLRDLSSVPTYIPPPAAKPVFDLNVKTDTTNFAARDKLVVASNPRLHVPIAQKGHAYAITHPGFAEVQIGSLREDVLAKDVNPRDEDIIITYANIAAGKYGDFEAHQRNMMRIFQTLGETTTSTVCLYDDINNPLSVRPEFRSPDNSFSLSTVSASGALEPEVSIRDDSHRNGYVYEPQVPELLFDAWKDAGVSEVHVGGEFSMMPDSGSTACLGMSTEMFLDAGFKVRGIRGAVFPPEAPKAPHNKRIADALYANAVPLEAVLGDR